MTYVTNIRYDLTLVGSIGAPLVGWWLWRVGCSSDKASTYFIISNMGKYLQNEGRHQEKYWPYGRLIFFFQYPFLFSLGHQATFGVFNSENFHDNYSYFSAQRERRWRTISPLSPYIKLDYFAKWRDEIQTNQWEVSDCLGSPLVRNITGWSSDGPKNFKKCKNQMIFREFI